MMEISSNSSFSDEYNSSVSEGGRNDCFSSEHCLLFKFFISGVLLGSVSIVGIFGNLISMVILSRPQMRSSINCILIGLARCDTVLLLTALLIFSLPSIHEYTGYFFVYAGYVFPKMAPILFPIGLIAQTGSVYLTLTVTLERYVAVCHPLKSRSLCTYGRARIYVILIIIFSILYNIPRFFEANIKNIVDDETNITISIIVASKLRENPTYITVYVTWSYLFVMYIVPFSCLAVFNTAIYRQVRKANTERQRLSRLQKKELSLATMLMCVVIVFFMCNFLALVNNIIESFYSAPQDELVATSNLLVAINSSVNIIIYVIFGEKFKRLFLKLFCGVGQSGHHQMTRTNVCCTGGMGRDSPEQTRDDSYMSNGNGRVCSVRHHMPSSSVYRHQRTMSNSYGGDSRQRISRSPSPNTCSTNINSIKLVNMNRNGHEATTAFLSPNTAALTPSPTLEIPGVYYGNHGTKNAHVMFSPSTPESPPASPGVEFPCVYLDNSAKNSGKTNSSKKANATGKKGVVKNADRVLVEETECGIKIHCPS